MEEYGEKEGMGIAGLSEEELFLLVSQDRLPRHIAIIMDGNGRWAERRYLPRIAGHRAGIQSVRETVTLCRELGVQALTIYAFSVENWKRPQEEIGELMFLLEEYLKKELKTMMEKDVRFQTIGQREKLPPSVIRWIRKAEVETGQNEGMILTIALSYGGRNEIVDAAGRIAEDVRRGKLAVEEIDESLFSGYLYTVGLPDPDLMIRTSGETRISNFLLWQSAYTELYFTRTLWPDFRRRHLLVALADYQQRERRFGLVGEQVRQKG